MAAPTSDYTLHTSNLLLDPALLKLMRLQSRGLVRRIGRGLRTVRGIAFFAIGLTIFGLWILSLALNSAQPSPGVQHVRAVTPVILLGICLLSTVTSAGEKAIAFTPGEVDFLFPGPFRRRELLLFKLTKSTFAALLTALVMSVAFRRFASSWIACYVAVFLSLLLVQFLSTALLLIAQTTTEHAYSRARKIVLAAIAILVALGLRGVVGLHLGAGLGAVDLGSIIEQFGDSDTGRFLLSPFRAYGLILTAEHVFPDLMINAAVAVTIDALLLAIVIRLDAGYLEAAAGATKRRYERLRRIRGGGVVSVAVGRDSRRSLPRFPFLWGGGPIAWRQMSSVLRSSRGLVIVLLILALLCGPFVITASPPGGHESSRAFLVRLSITLGWVAVLAASMLKFDFRSDLDAIEVLKTLPLHPSAIVAGEVAAPVLVLTLIHWVLLTAMSRVSRLTPFHRDALLTAAAVVPAFNILLFAVENLVFLFFPVRPAAVGPGDFQVMGRQIFTLGFRTIVVILAFSVAAGFGVLAFKVCNEWMPAFAIVTDGFVLLETAALLPLLGWAFRRYDPSLHTPAN